MKRLTTLMLGIVLFATMATAKTIYVNASTGSDTNNGLTWGAAVQSIPYALTLTTVSGDVVWVAGGNYTIPGTSTLSPSYSMYGGFLGDETATSQRPKNDLDGNGIVESWEFTNASVLSFNVTDRGALYCFNKVFDGFTLTGTIALNNNSSSAYNFSTFASCTNNIFKNSNLTLSVGTLNTSYYPFFQSSGTTNNCLFENNSVTVTATQSGYVFPFITAYCSLNPTAASKFLNNVIRNNAVTIDYSAAGTTSNGGIRSLILGVLGAMNPTVATAQTGGLATVVANCLIYNNEITYLPGVGGSSYLSGGVISTGNARTYNSVSQPTTDTIMNCTVANNKGNRVSCGGLYIVAPASTYHNVINNVFYNNQKSLDGSTYSVSNMAQTSTTNSGVLSNNFTDGAGISNSTTPLVENSDATLATNLPNFKTPTTTIGKTTDGSTELSNWTLTAGSYLIGKGVATTRLTDMNGVTFATPRAVGAYEYVADVPTAVETIAEIKTAFYASKGNLISTINGKVEVINFAGLSVWTGKVVVGQIINLPAGAYIIRSSTEKGSSVQKIVL